MFLMSSFSTIALLGVSSEPINAATKTYTFSDGSETQSKTFILPSDFISLNSIKVNSGNVSYNIKGDEIKITVSNGEATSNTPFYNDKLYLLPNYITTIYSDSNNFANTIDYETSDGYSGKLALTGSPYVSNGSVTPGAQMTVTTTETSSANDFPETILYEKDRFKGILNKLGSATQTLISGGSFTKQTKNGTLSLTSSTNSFPATTLYDDGNYRGNIAKATTLKYGVISGKETPAETKWVTGQTSANYNSGGYTGTLSKYIYSTTTVPEDTKTVTLIVNRSGTCYNDGSSTWRACAAAEFPHIVGTANAYYYSDAEGYKGGLTTVYYKYGQQVDYYDSTGHNTHYTWQRTWVFNGEVTKPGSTRTEYRYQGTVTKAATDTRAYGNSTSTYGILSGSYTPSDTKWVTGQTSANYNSGGYTGTLDKYVSGKTYVPAQTKTYTKTYTMTGRCDDNGRTADWDKCSVYPGDPQNQYITDGGYSGTIRYVPNSYTYDQTCWETNCKGFTWTRTWTMSGTLTKPGYYEDAYAYQGYVTKSANDARFFGYTQDYSGEAVKYLKVTQALQSDINSFPNTLEYQDQNGYSGTLDKTGSVVNDNGVYEQNYTGYIYSQTIDNRVYGWSQQYQGTVSQEDIDSRVWAAEYSGDLYKGGQDYSNKQYDYTVTIDYSTTKPSNCSYLGISPITTDTIKNYVPLCTTLDDGSEKLYSFYYDFIVTGISNVQAGK